MSSTLLVVEALQVVLSGRALVGWPRSASWGSILSSSDWLCSCDSASVPTPDVLASSRRGWRFHFRPVYLAIRSALSLGCPYGSDRSTKRALMRSCDEWPAINALQISLVPHELATISTESSSTAVSKSTSETARSTRPSSRVWRPPGRSSLPRRRAKPLTRSSSNG